MAEKILEVKNLHVTFGKGRNAFEAVKGVSFDIFKGETFGLVGESGSGKTTIGRAIIRVYPTSGGDVIYKGNKINGRIDKALDTQIPRQIQMIFQDPMASLNERAKIDYIVSEGIRSQGLSKEALQEKVNQALADVGLLPEFASRFPHEFSGGQRQRIGIARALIMNPEFIVADEPISALDVSIRAQVLNLMAQLQKQRGLTYLFISHDLSVMRFICDRIAVIHKGLLVELAELKNFSPIPCILTPGRCYPPFRSPTHRLKKTRCWKFMIPANTIMKRINPSGARLNLVISFWVTRRNWLHTAARSAKHKRELSHRKLPLNSKDCRKHRQSF